MGCCASTPSTSPYSTEEPSSSSRAAINNTNPSNTHLDPASHAALPRPSSTVDSTSRRESTGGGAAGVGAGGTHHPSSRRHSHHAAAATRRPLSEHFNKPLRVHVWSSKDKIWTRQEIDFEREAFFDTRVSGRAEIWMTLRAALELLWLAGAVVHDVDDDGTGSVATAQSILDAADITLPTGDLANGAYDAFGAFYSLPEWVVADPQNLTAAPAGEHDGGGATEDDKNIEVGEGGGGATALEEEEDGEELLRRREEKGKAVIAEKDLIKVKARLSDRGGPDVLVTIGKEESVRLLTRLVFEEARLSHPQRVRICYMGKMLKENESLIAQGWEDGHVVNALVFRS